MTKLALILEHKKQYAMMEEIIPTIEDPFEKLIAKTMILPWIKGRNWIGGLSDTKASEVYVKYFEPLGYTSMQVYDAFNEFTEKYFPM